MGEIDFRAELKKDNPRVSDIDIKIFVDALMDYRTAAKNIATNGTICSHPRTGAPIENPYLKIRTQTAKAIGGMARIKSDRILALIEQQESAN